jgi:hypothetical protein
MKQVLNAHHISLFSIFWLSFWCLLSLGQLQRIEWSSLPAFYLHEIVIAGYLCVHVFEKKWWNHAKDILKKVPTLGWVCLSWVGGGLLFSLFTATPSALPFLYLARILLYVTAAVTLHQDLQQHRLSNTTFWFGLFSFFGLLIYFGILQYLLLPDTTFLFFLGWDDHYYRMISTLLDPGFTGIVYCLGYVLTTVWLVQNNNHSAKNTTPFSYFSANTIKALAGALVLGTLLTYSRASYVALLVSFVLIAFSTWKKYKIIFWKNLFFAVIFIATIPFLPRPGGEGVKLERTSTITARTQSIETALQTMNTPHEFVIGQGLFVQPTPDTSQYSQSLNHAKQPDNWMILILTGTGGVGTVLILLVLAQSLYASYNAKNYIWIGILTVLAHGLFNASITYPFVLLILGAWVAKTTTRGSLPSSLVH